MKRQTPNTQFTVAEYPVLPILFDNRNLSMRKDTVVLDHFRNRREGFVLQYEGGYFAGLRAGGLVPDPAGKEVQRFRGDGGAGQLEQARRLARGSHRTPFILPA